MDIAGFVLVSNLERAHELTTLSATSKGPSMLDRPRKLEMPCEIEVVRPVVVLAMSKVNAVRRFEECELRLTV